MAALLAALVSLCNLFSFRAITSSSLPSCQLERPGLHPSFPAHPKLKPLKCKSCAKTVLAAAYTDAQARVDRLCQRRRIYLRRRGVP